MLRKGIRASGLRALLGGMRAWYRLTALGFSAADRFAITAVLNPSEQVTLGATVDLAGVQVEANRMLRALRQMSLEIYLGGIEDLQAIGGLGAVQRNRALAGGDERGSHQEPHGTRGAMTQAIVRRRTNLNATQGDVVSRETRSGETLDAQRNPGRGAYPRANRIVLVQFPGHPLQDLAYSELPARLAEMGQNLGPNAVNELLQDVIRLLRGGGARGAHRQLAYQLKTWIIQQETHRNIASFATHAMIIDMLSRGTMTVEDAVAEDWVRDRRANPLTGKRSRQNSLGFFAMQPRGSQNRARILSRYLDASVGQEASGGAPLGRFTGFAEANRLALREIETLRRWLDSLESLKVEDPAGALSKQDQLILEVRRRILELHSANPIASDDEFLASLNTRMHLEEFDAEA